MKTVLKLVLFAWMLVVIVGAFLWAPLAQRLYESTRIMYFHVPVSMITVVMFVASAWFSIQYLRRRDLRDDARASIWAELGLVACLLATVTGAIWAKAMWGTYWNWDPRETSIFLLLLIYAAYVTLRTSIEDEERRASLSATYSVIAVVTVPFLVFVVPRIYFSLHPDPLINSKGKVFMEPRMRGVLFASMAGFLAIFWWMYRIHLRMALARLGARSSSGREI